MERGDRILTIPYSTPKTPPQVTAGEFSLWKRYDEGGSHGRNGRQERIREPWVKWVAAAKPPPTEKPTTA